MNPARSISALLVWVLLLGGCDGALELAVDLRTDYVPGVEVDRVQIEWSRDGQAPLGERSHMLDSSRDYVTGVRVAELSGLSPGVYRLELSMFDGERLLSTRATLLDLRTHAAITVRITRDCAGVVCPGGGSAQLTTCLDGRCVDPRCRLDQPDQCLPDVCVSAAECGETAHACLRGECVAGVCFEIPDERLCAPGQACDPTSGCVGEVPDGGADAGIDAGPRPDAGPEVDAGDCAATEMCMPGVDADCDGLVFCADPDCAGMACDDGALCTHGDQCAAGVCAGTPITCDDAPCVTRACDGSPSCVETPAGDGSPCPDDGNACTTDTCSGAVCSHPARADGSSLGGAMRCCGGSPTNVNTDAQNCGACGLACSSGFGCVISAGEPTCDCGAANAQCHGGRPNHLCSTTYGVCACLLDSACPGSATCVERAGAADVCQY